jgi:hypothetical protein
MRAPSAADNALPAERSQEADASNSRQLLRFLTCGSVDDG